MKYLKLCINEWVNANRDKRECSVVRELGVDVSVIAKGPVSGVKEEVAGFSVTRLSPRPLGKKMPVLLNRVVSMFTWAAYVRKQNYDIISGHDYVALTIAWISNVGKRCKAMLVYDSHEFELGRAVNRGRFATWFLCHWERFLMRRCAFSIMVNDAIADEVQRIHRLEQRPVVVRNIPNYWRLDETKISATRKEILSALGLSEETFLVMYHGAVVHDRGIENMLRAVAKMEGSAAVVLGNGAEDYLFSLRNLCEELGVKNRTLFLPAVPVETLYRYVGAADVEAVLIVGKFKSYYFSLPNKIFEAIQSLTSLVVSDFPEMGRLIGQYGIGLKIDPTKEEEIVDAFTRLRDDKEFRAQCKENLKRAKEDLCWEREQEALKAAYREIIK